MSIPRQGQEGFKGCAGSLGPQSQSVEEQEFHQGTVLFLLWQGLRVGQGWVSDWTWRETWAYLGGERKLPV